ncbi:MBL fold metallo-hydrolase [Phenylobacterium sp.]|uniref:MBL fold metallo-hydrolase n=1 Tax=Phenylobacterium sp. TaxID=1871053 RepID=UPI002FC91469
MANSATNTSCLLSDPAAAFLDRGVKIEPLVDRWSAWPHLLSPVTQALNLNFRYLPLARSFVSAPNIHIAANDDPTMFGGPFLGLPVEAVQDVSRYIVEVESRRGAALSFAQQFREFDVTLQSADGYCLNDFREKIPSSLRGLIELNYDLNNHPRIRLYEEMFIENDLGHESAQELLLHRQRDVDRPFFLSTPRLSSDLGLFIKSTFDSEAATYLGEARDRPIDLNRLAALCGISVGNLIPYFTNEPRPAADVYSGDGVRVRYFGHACILIETSEISILIDPTFANDETEETSHLTGDDLPPRIDIVFLSHGHQDHFHPESLLRIRNRVGVVIIPPTNRGELSDPSMKSILKRMGFRSVITLDYLEPYDVPGGTITSLPFSGEHCDLDIHSKQCAIFELNGRRIATLVDSDAIDIDVYMRLVPLLSRLDLMFIGMECYGAPLSWLYGPLITGSLSRKNDNSRRLSGANAQNARRLTEALKPRNVFVYAMGQEPWMRSLMGLQYAEDSIQLAESSEYVDWCRSIGIPAERLLFEKEVHL